MQAVEEMGLPPLEEVQHKMNARKTFRREKARNRMHRHRH